MTMEERWVIQIGLNLWGPIPRIGGDGSGRDDGLIHSYPNLLVV